MTLLHTLFKFITWLLFRLKYFIKLKLNYFLFVLPTTRWKDLDLNQKISSTKKKSGKFFFDHQTIYNTKSILKNNHLLSTQPLELAKKLHQGIFRFYSYHLIQTGTPPNWHKNYFTGEVSPKNLHWSKINDFRHGDIKNIWELSRFSFVFDLVRAYSQTRDEQYAKLFWSLFENWLEENQPQSGVNWKCGQEVSLRFMAITFGYFAFQKSKEATNKRIHSFLKLVYVSASRIEKNISYALSQKNNHGITEAVGLLTAGILFPFFKSSNRWLNKGKSLIIEQVDELFYTDGSFSQQSMNYERLALDTLIWALQLGRINKVQFPQKTISRLSAAFKFLYQLQDNNSGKTPNYGPNDGAWFLQLSDTNYRNYNQVVQCLYYLLNNKKILDAGPWDEALFWLFGQQALDAPQKKYSRSELQCKISGYYTLRNKNSFLFIRGGHCLHRETQQDMLHCDIWWQGINIATDSGSYSYNAPSPFNESFKKIYNHNTAYTESMAKRINLSRFLSYPWTQAILEKSQISYSKDLRYLRFKNLTNTYNSQYTREIIALNPDTFVVIDSIVNKDPETCHIRWHFAPTSYDANEKNTAVVFQTPNGNYYFKCLCLSQNASPAIIKPSYTSEYYQHLSHALQFQQQIKSSESKWITIFSSLNHHIKLIESQKVKIQFKNSSEIILIHNPFHVRSIAINQQSPFYI